MVVVVDVVGIAIGAVDGARDDFDVALALGRRLRITGLLPVSDPGRAGERDPRAVRRPRRAAGAALTTSVSARASPPPMLSTIDLRRLGLPVFLERSHERDALAVRRPARRRVADFRRSGVAASPTPLDGTANSDVSYRLSFSLTVTLTNATVDPSGEICGSAIHVNLNRSFSVMNRLPCAAPGRR